MSILNVEHLSHGFGDRAIFHDVSFRLLKGELRTGRRQRRGKIHLHEHHHRQIAAGRGQGGVVQERPCRIFRPACGSGKGHDDPGRIKERIFFPV